MHLIVSTIARSVALATCIRIAIVRDMVLIFVPMIMSRPVNFTSAIYLGGLMAVNVGEGLLCI